MIKILCKKLTYNDSILRNIKFKSKSFKLRFSNFLICPFLLWKHIHIYTGKFYFTILITKNKIGININKYIYYKKYNGTKIKSFNF